MELRASMPSRRARRRSAQSCLDSPAASSGSPRRSTAASSRPWHGRKVDRPGTFANPACSAWREAATRLAVAVRSSAMYCQNVTQWPSRLTGWAIPISTGGTTGAPSAASEVATWSFCAEASTSRAILATTGLGRIHVTTLFVEPRLTGTPTSSPWSRTSCATAVINSTARLSHLGNSVGIPRRREGGFRHRGREVQVASGHAVAVLAVGAFGCSSKARFACDRRPATAPNRLKRESKPFGCSRPTRLRSPPARTSWMQFGRTMMDLSSRAIRTEGKFPPDLDLHCQRVAGIELACPAWEVQKWQFSDQLKSEKCLIRCQFDYPMLPAGNRCFPCHGARLVARNACADLLAGHGALLASDAAHSNFRLKMSRRGNGVGKVRTENRSTFSAILQCSPTSDHTVFVLEADRGKTDVRMKLVNDGSERSHEGRLEVFVHQLVLVASLPHSSVRPVMESKKSLASFQQIQSRFVPRGKAGSPIPAMCFESGPDCLSRPWLPPSRDGAEVRIRSSLQRRRNAETTLRIDRLPRAG
jgi:hypothetical protein